MANNDCKMARSLKIILGIFFSFLGFGLVMIGITYLPVIGIVLAAISFVVALLFFLSPKDPGCYLTR